MKKVALVLLYNSAGKLLIQRKTNDAPIFAGCWVFFGGQIESGETPLEAAVREIKEELDYDVLGLELFTFVVDTENDAESHIYIAPYDGSLLTLHEGAGMDWFFAEETDALKMSNFHRSMIREVQKKVREILVTKTDE